MYVEKKYHLNSIKNMTTVNLKDRWQFKIESRKYMSSSVWKKGNTKIYNIVSFFLYIISNKQCIYNILFRVHHI